MPRIRRTFRQRHARVRRMGVLARGGQPNHPRRRAMVKDEPVPFVIGRISKSDRRMVVLEPATPSPIPGPWDLRAVFGL
ncbi:hypothetical protein [Longimicrobium sp.]|uniref:hypothetical protein n=1 Tax=Longimicrobium sp. TaxID=2029185 RepID=UPI002C5FC837|nr:hypothetical protein [Longimicrobium sp.]HSU16642.1 hypothetical protein [Longimicrobium sp.]